MIQATRSIDRECWQVSDESSNESGLSARHQKYKALVEAARKLPWVTRAIAHPCNTVSLESAIKAAKLGLIEPILVGPAARIRDVASSEGFAISEMSLIDTEHIHDSAAR